MVVGGSTGHRALVTGGYVIEDYQPGVRVDLKRNPNYWREDRAYFDRVEALVVKDVAARSNALITNKVDLIDQLDPKVLNLLSRNPDVEIDEVASGSHTVMSMRTDMAPFDNNDVRLALKLGLDREALLDIILRGHGTIGNDHPIAPTMPFHADLPQRHYDPDKARFHLKQAGLDRLEVTLSAAEVWVGAVDARGSLPGTLLEGGHRYQNRSRTFGWILDGHLAQKALRR